MSTSSPAPVLETVKAAFAAIAAEHNLLDAEVVLTVSPLSAEEAIGHPTRRDFPIVEGKERVIEATVKGARGQAFTDSPREFCGSLRDVLARPLSSNYDRSLFLAALNAALRLLGVIDAILHCRDEDPEKCAKELAGHVMNKNPSATVGLIGLNPALAEALVGTFGPENVRITDMNRKNIAAVRFGVTVWDGRTQTEELIRQSNVVVVTGTTLANGTFDGIWNSIQANRRDYVIYGVTAAGVCKLMGWDRMCPYSRSA